MGDVEHEIERIAAALDAEVRGEQAAYEHLALLATLRARRMADVAREALHRGDRVAALLGAHPPTGTVAHVGEDYTTLHTPAGEADVVLGAAPLAIVERSRSGGASGGGPATLRARLTAHEDAGRAVVATLITGRDVTGVVTAVARDHLLLGGPAGDVAVPLTLLGVVRVAAQRD